MSTNIVTVVLKRSVLMSPKTAQRKVLPQRHKMANNDIVSFIDENGDEVAISLPRIFNENNPIDKHNLDLLKSLIKEKPESYKDVILLDPLGDAQANVEKRKLRRDAETLIKVLEDANVLADISRMARRVSLATNVTPIVIIDQLYKLCESNPKKVIDTLNNPQYELLCELDTAIDKGLVVVENNNRAYGKYSFKDGGLIGRNEAEVVAKLQSDVDLKAQLDYLLGNKVKDTKSSNKDELKEVEEVKAVETIDPIRIGRIYHALKKADIITENENGIMLGEKILGEDDVTAKTNLKLIDNVYLREELYRVYEQYNDKK